MKSRIYIVFPFINTLQKFIIENVEFKGLFESGTKLVNNFSLEDKNDQYHLNNILGSFRLSENNGLQGFTYSIQEVSTQEEYEDLKKRTLIATNIIRYKLFDKDERGHSNFPQTTLYVFELTETEWKSKETKLKSGNKFFWYKGTRDFVEEISLNWPKELLYPLKHRIGIASLSFPAKYFLLSILDKSYWKFRNFKEDERLRIIRAIELYNKSYVEGAGVDDNNRILNLSAGFEAILSLPDERIQQAFRSMIITLLGDIGNLGDWALDFYNLRSKIVHGEEILTLPRIKPTKQERKTPSLFFKHSEGDYEFIKHLEIGQSIFRKCLEIILHQRNEEYIYDIVSLLEPNEVHLKRIEVGLKSLKNKTSFVEWYEKGILDEYDELKPKDKTANIDKVVVVGIELLILLKRYLKSKDISLDKPIDNVITFKGKYIDLAMAYHTLNESFEKIYFGNTTKRKSTEEFAMENAVYSFISFASNVLFAYQGNVKNT